MKKPDPPRPVTARELARKTSELLDEVEDGRSLMVVRHRVPIAVIEPTEEGRLIAQARAPRVDTAEEPEEEFDLDSLDLMPVAFEVLKALERVDRTDHIRRDTGLSVGEVHSSLGILEGRRLMTRGLGGFRLTELGERALDAYRRAEA